VDREDVNRLGFPGECENYRGRLGERQSRGFDYCGPFRDYKADSFSRCMTLELTDIFEK
jgi:hypothetical protein